MQNQTEFESHIETHQTKYAFATRSVLGLITGSDTFYTLAKQGCTWELHFKNGINSVVRMSNLSKGGAAAYFAFPILVASGIGIPIYIASAAIEEYERYQIEKERLKQAELLGLEVKYINDNLNRRFEGIDFSSKDNGEYNLDNDQLLVYILREYLRAHALLDTADYQQSAAKKRGPKDYLPGQEGMIRHIEKALSRYHRQRISRNDPHFANKVKLFISKQAAIPGLKLPDDFCERITTALNLGQINDIPVDIEPVIKKPQPKWLRNIKNVMHFLHRNNTAMAMVTGVCLVAGLAISWPALIVALIIGPLTGIAGIIYSRYIAKINKRKTQETNQAIEFNRTRHELLYKLNSLQTKKYHYNTDPVPEAIEIQGEAPQKFATPEIDKATKRRILIHTIAQAGYWLSIGLVVGIAITCTICLLAPILIPGIPLVGLPLFATSFTWTGLAAGLMGLVYGVRYAFKNGKDYFTKAAREEKNRIIQVAERVENCRKRFGPEMEKRITQTKEQLVVELIESYNNYSRKLSVSTSKMLGKFVGEEAAQAAFREALTKKEMILLMLEEATGIRRDRDSETGLPQNNCENFYKNLSLLIQNDKQLAPIANQLLSEFKSEITGIPLNACTVDAQPATGWWTKFNKKNFFSANRQVNKYIFPAAGAACIALVLGAMTFGLGLVIAFGVVAVAVGVFFTIQKVCEYKAAKNLENLANTEMKVSLIETIEKVKKTTSKLVVVDSPKETIAVKNDESEWKKIQRQPKQAREKIHSCSDRGFEERFISGEDRVQQPFPRWQSERDLPRASQKVPEPDNSSHKFQGRVAVFKDGYYSFKGEPLEEQNQDVLLVH